MAHVHVVIIGFAAFDTANKRIYDYESDKVTVATAKNISPYLVEGFRTWRLSLAANPCATCQTANTETNRRTAGISSLKKDRQSFSRESRRQKYLRPLLCAEEYLLIPRWCLWLWRIGGRYSRHSGIKQRVEAVRDFQLASKENPQHVQLPPTLFAEIRQPKTRFMVVPQHTSENRKYVPFGYFKADNIVHNSCSAIPEATLFHFGVLSSNIHMAWVKQVCGRLESRYRYSTRLVYNNYPWPESATDKQRAAVEAKAQAVLDARKPHLPPHGMSTLADLYDPLSMPPELVKAHAELDCAVENVTALNRSIRTASVWNSYSHSTKNLLRLFCL